MDLIVLKGEFQAHNDLAESERKENTTDNTKSQRISRDATSKINGEIILQVSNFHSHHALKKRFS